MSNVLDDEVRRACTGVILSRAALHVEIPNYIANDYDSF
jgi:hypothetical protein